MNRDDSQGRQIPSAGLRRLLLNSFAPFWYHGGRWLVAFAVSFITALFFFRSFLPLLSVASPSASAILAVAPWFPRVDGPVAIQWFFRPDTILATILTFTGGSEIQAETLTYVLTAAFGGLALYALSSTLLRDLFRSVSPLIDLAAMAGAVVYISQPLFNLFDSFWIFELQTYSAVPALMLLFHIILTRNRASHLVLCFFVLSCVTSYLFVFDSHSLTIIPIALLWQFSITASIRGRGIWKRAVVALPSSIAYALAMGLPALSYVYSSHVTATQYVFGLQSSSSETQIWAGSSQTLWLFLNDVWFNRAGSFAQIYTSHPVLQALTVLGSALIAILGLLGILSAKSRTGRLFVMPFAIALTIVVMVYAPLYGGSSVAYSFLNSSNAAVKLISEGYLPTVIISVSYAVLTSTLVSVSLIAALTGKGVAEGSTPTQLPQTSKHFQVPVKFSLARRGKSIDVTPGVIVLVIVVGASLQASPAYLLGEAGVTPFTGQAVNANSSTLVELGPVASYLSAHESGNVLWIPGPILFGSGTPLVSRSFLYPQGSDAPLATEFFNYLLGDAQTSLLSTKNWQALSELSSDIGVAYFILWGKGSDIISGEMIGSGYFSSIISEPLFFLVLNDGYSGPDVVSSHVALIDGGLTAYTNYLSLGAEEFPDSTPVAFFSDLAPSPSEVLDNNQTMFVGTNYSSMATNLAIDLSGQQYLIAPLSRLALPFNPNQEWSGGNVADASGYPWNWIIDEMPNYSWQFSYTINDGFVYTFAPNVTFELSIPVPSTGLYQVLVRTLVSSTYTTNLTATIGGRSYALSSGIAPTASLVWNDLGTMSLKQGGSTLEVTSNSRGAINVVAVIPEEVWTRSISEALSTLNLSPSTIVSAQSSSQDGTSNWTSDLPFPRNYGLLTNGIRNWSASLNQANSTYILTSNDSGIATALLPRAMSVGGFSNNTTVTTTNPYMNLTSFSVSTWVRWNGQPTQYECIASQWGINGSFEWDIATIAGQLTASIGGAKFINVYSGVTLQSDIWYLVTLTVNPSNATLYVNGMQAGQPVSHSQVSTIAGLNIGFQSNSNPIPWHGEIASLVFSPQALSASEVSDVFDYGPAAVGPASFTLNFNGSSVTPSPPFGSTVSSTNNVTNVTVDSATAPTGLLLARTPELVKQPAESGWPYVSLPALANGNVTVRSNAKPQQLAILHNIKAPVTSSVISSVVETSDTPAGQVVSRLSLKVPQSLVGLPLYVSVAGFGASVITADSGVVVGSTSIQAAPAFGVTLGVVIPGDLSTNNMTIDVVWSDSGLVTIENDVALCAFFSGLGVTVFAITVAFVLSPEKKRRLLNREPIRKVLRRLRLHRVRDEATNGSRKDASVR